MPDAPVDVPPEIDLTVWASELLDMARDLTRKAEQFVAVQASVDRFVAQHVPRSAGNMVTCLHRDLVAEDGFLSCAACGAIV